MLRISQQSSIDGAKRYYASADYYSEGQELVGLWGGKTATMLGLSGRVDKRSFDMLCENRDPRDGSKLTARDKAQRTVGYDFTWSVPKSVSLLYGLTEDAGILAAFRSAVDETMRDIETEMKARVRVGRQDSERTTGNMIWAEYIHKTARPIDGIPDAQLHSHCFVFNVTYDLEERRFKAGYFRDLKRDAPYFQAAFKVRLAGKLQELGFTIERKKDDFEIVGVPASAIRKFSRRTQQIERMAEELGIVDPDRKAELGQQTRERKVKDLPWPQLQQEWRKRLSDSELSGIERTHRRRGSRQRILGGEREALAYAMEHSFAREAVVPERKFLTEALKRGVGTVSLAGIEQEYARQPLVRSREAGRTLVTSHAMIDAEKGLVAFARAGRGRERPLALGWEIRRDLNRGQRNAVRHVLSSRDTVSIVRGAAGTGKTTLESELRDALAARGIAVAAMAQTTPACRELGPGKAGFEQSTTVAAFVRSREKQAAIRGGVILVDEAGMLGTKDIGQLFDIAKEQSARVILVGDRRQHRAVSAGEPLRLLEEFAGLKAADVTEIVRQTRQEYKKIAAELVAGRVDAAFAGLDRLGWVHEIEDGQRYQVLAQEYLLATAERKKDGELKSALVVTPTHAEANLVQSTIRQQLKSQGKLGEERLFDIWIPAQLTSAEKSDAVNFQPGDLLKFHQNAPGCPKGSRVILGEGDAPPVQYADRFEVFRPAKLALAAGDRIRITANIKDKTGKHKFANGSLLTVKGFSRAGDIIVDDGRMIAKDLGHIAHGYAVTSHASQGQTVDKVFIAIASGSLPAASQRSFYVQVTRGREMAQLFTDDKESLLDAVKRPDQPLSALELAGRQRPAVRLGQRLRRNFERVRRATLPEHRPPSVKQVRELQFQREWNYGR